MSDWIFVRRAGSSTKMVRVVRIRRERRYRIAARLMAASWPMYEIARVLSLSRRRLDVVLRQRREHDKFFSQV